MNQEVSVELPPLCVFQRSWTPRTGWSWTAKRCRRGGAGV